MRYGNDMSLKEKFKPKAKWRVDKFEDPTGEIERLLKKGKRTKLGWVVFILTLGRRDIRRRVTIEEVVKHYKKNYIGKLEFEGNVFLNEGIAEIWDLVTGVSANHFDEASTEIGVGDDATAEDATQTDLLATVNVAWVGMDTGYPTRTAQTLTFRGTFGGAVANFTWNECSVRHITTLINLNRKVQAMGTKAEGTTWVLTLDLTIA